MDTKLKTSQWEFSQFHSIVSKDKIDNVYSFVGDESYLSDQALTLLKAKVLTPGTEEFNLNVYYGDEVDFDEFKNVVETLPMLADKRLVVLREAHQLKTAQLDQLLELVSVPCESAVVALFFEKVDQRKKIFKDLFKQMCVVDVTTPKDRETTQWIHLIAKTYQKKLSPQVVMALQQFVGSRLANLDNEIRKLSLYAGECEQIEVGDVEAVVSRTRLESVFQLTDALGAQQSQKALLHLKYLLDQGENEIGMLAMLTRHVRMLLFVQEGLSQKLSSASLSSYAGVAPFFLQNYVDQCAKWSQEKIKKMYKLLLVTDRSLKSVPISGTLLLENLILKSCV